MSGNLRPGKPRLYDIIAATGLIMLSALASGCSERVPEGQVLVVLDDTEVTIRELQEVLQGQGLDASSQNAELEALVARKILSNEAERRGLQSSGEFHFALREARETLLVRALRSDIEQTMSPNFEDAVQRELEAFPWRYANRFVATLQRGGSSDDLIVIDSANLDRSPPVSLQSGKQGDRIALEGQSWTIVGRRDVHAPIREQRAQALQLLRRRAVDANIEEIVEKYRQSGRIRYQKGWGAAAEGPR